MSIPSSTSIPYDPNGAIKDQLIVAKKESIPGESIIQDVKVTFKPLTIGNANYIVVLRGLWVGPNLEEASASCHKQEADINTHIFECGANLSEIGAKVKEIYDRSVQK